MPKRLAVYIIILLLYSLLLPVSLFAKTEPEIFINGQNLTNELKPIQKNNQLLVNARTLADSLEAELKWYQAIKTISLTRDNINIKMMVNNPYIQINNKTVKTNSRFIIKDGHSYIPLKAVSEAFGYLYQVKSEAIYIFKPETVVQEINWQHRGQQLMVKMDKLAPYRIRLTDDPKKMIIELDKASLAKDFNDRFSNKNFYLKINKAEKMARLQLVIISKYPIPFQRDEGIEEEDNNLIINFLPQIMAVNWEKEELKIEATGEINKPEMMLLDNPRRLVIDIPKMMLNKYDLNLPKNNYIKDIRISQFKYEPVILRVVIELKEGKNLYLRGQEQANKLVLKPSQLTKVEQIFTEGSNIVFQTNGSVNPDIFSLKDPDRVVINLINTVRDNNLPDELDINGKLVKKIRTARFNEETIRIVADLARLTGYSWQEKQLPSGKYQYIISLEKTANQIKLTDSDNKTDINITLNVETEYQIKKLSEPDRLVIDVKGLKNSISEDKLPAPVGLITDIRANQFDEDTVRFVFDLKDYFGHVNLSSNPDKFINLSLNKTKEKPVGHNAIVIDAGHGGFDPGALGPSGLQEKDINLDIALRVADLLKKAGYQVILTRENDQFISLRKRVEISNKAKSRLFVSIHINASSEEFAQGTETYLAPNKVADSSLLAEYLQTELVTELKRPDRGIKEGNLYVIKYTDMPAALVEIAFISNPHEETLLEGDFFKTRTAGALFRGIVKYLEKIGQGDDMVHD